MDNSSFPLMRAFVTGSGNPVHFLSPAVRSHDGGFSASLPRSVYVVYLEEVRFGSAPRAVLFWWGSGSVPNGSVFVSLQQEGLDDGPDFLSEEDRGVSVLPPVCLSVPVVLLTCPPGSELVGSGSVTQWVNTGSVCAPVSPQANVSFVLTGCRTGFILDHSPVRFGWSHRPLAEPANEPQLVEFGSNRTRLSHDSHSQPVQHWN